MNYSIKVEEELRSLFINLLQDEKSFCFWSSNKDFDKFRETYSIFIDGYEIKWYRHLTDHKIYVCLSEISYSPFTVLGMFEWDLSDQELDKSVKAFKTKYSEANWEDNVDKVLSVIRTKNETYKRKS